MAVDVGDPTGELEQLVTRLRSPEYVAAARAARGVSGRAAPVPRRSGWAGSRGMRELGLGALLADDMGLGKTAQVIAYWLLDRVAAWELDRAATLIVCPASVLP